MRYLNLSRPFRISLIHRIFFIDLYDGIMIKIGKFNIKSSTYLIVKRNQVVLLSADMNTIEWKFYMKLIKYHERPLCLNLYRGINKAIIHLKGKIH